MEPGRDRTHDPWICSQTRIDLLPDTLPTALRGPVEFVLLILLARTLKKADKEHINRNPAWMHV